jgi:hypothetical protein
MSLWITILDILGSSTPMRVTVDAKGRRPAGVLRHNKYSYHRRKVVWDKMAELVRAGWTAQTAIDRIHAAYGAGVSVTTIINQM